MQAEDGTRFLAAAAHVLAAVALLGLVDNFIRLVAAEAGLWQFHLTRSAMVAVLLAAGMAVFGWRLRPRHWGWVATRSFFLSASMVVYFAAIALMPIAQVAAGLFTSPIFVVLITVFVLRQRVGPWRILAVATGFAGGLMVLRPEAGGFTPLAVLPVAAGMLYAAQVVITRHRCAGEGTMCLQAWFFAALALWSVAGLVFVHLVLPAPGDSFPTTGWVSPTWPFLLWTGVQAGGSLLALALLTRGYQMAEPTRLAVFEYGFLASVSLWAWVLWDEVLSPLGYAGIALIALAGAVISLRSGSAPSAGRKAAAP